MKNIWYMIPTRVTTHRLGNSDFPGSFHISVFSTGKTEQKLGCLGLKPQTPWMCARAVNQMGYDRNLLTNALHTTWTTLWH